MKHTEATIDALVNEYGIEQLKTFFVKRLDDDLFHAVGFALTEPSKRRHTTRAEKIWVGYERLALGPGGYFSEKEL